jgi:hypothetical protein
MLGQNPKLNRRHFVTKNEFRNTRREKVVIIISEEYKIGHYYSRKQRKIR